MSVVTIGKPLPLTLLLDGGDTNLFPQAIVLDDNNQPVSGSPFNLTHIGNGFYASSDFTPSTLSPHFRAIYLVYDDPAHTQLSGVYGETSEVFDVNFNIKTSYDISVPQTLELPTSGQKTYRFVLYTFDANGAPIDPDLSQVFIHIVNINNTIIVPLTTVQREEAGVFWYRYIVNSTDPEQALWVEFTYNRQGVPFIVGKTTETVRVRSVLDVLDTTKLTQARAQNLDLLDAAISSRQSEVAAASRYTTLNANQVTLIGIGNSIVALIGSPFGGSVQAALDAIKVSTDRVGTPQTSTLAGDLLSIISQLVKLGTPLSGSLAGDITALSSRLGAPIGVSISADIAAVKGDTNKIGTPSSGSVSSDIATIQSKLGTPASSTMSGDIFSLQGAVTLLLTRIGSPSGASLALDIASIKLDSTSLLSRLSAQRAQLLDNLDVPMSSRESESAASSRYAQLEAEHSAILAGIGSVPNNTTFVGIVPPILVLPEVGSKTYKFYVNLFNTDGTPGDPDSNVISLRVMDLAANVLAGSINMAQLGTGRYVYNYVVNAADVEQPLQVVFEYNKNGIFYQHRRLTEVQEYESKLDVLIQRITVQRAANLDNLNVSVSSLETESAASTRMAALVDQLNQILTAENQINVKVGTPQSNLASEIELTLSQLSKLGNPFSGTISGDISLISGYVQKIGSPTAGTLAGEMALLEGRIGSPMGSSLASDLAAVKQDTIKIGSPNFGSLCGDIADVKTLLIAGSPILNLISTLQSLLTQVNAKLGSPFNGSLSLDISQITSKLGTPPSGTIASILASVAAQAALIGTVLSELNALDTKVGMPSFGSLASDIAHIDLSLDTGTLQSDITLMKNRIGIPVSTLVADLDSLLTLINAIPANPLLTIDPRLNNLDVPISSRATSGSLSGEGSEEGLFELIGLIDSDNSDPDLIGVIEE